MDDSNYQKQFMRRETETRPAMEVHLGESFMPSFDPAIVKQFARHCIIWFNGKRWEGTLYEEEEREISHGESGSPIFPGQ